MDRYFNTKELSDYLRIPEQTIRKWVLKNEIAYIRIHNIIRFRLSEIEKWIDNNRDKVPGLSDVENELPNDTETLADTGDEPETTEETGGLA
jgi:excisionase family DNA binding protein